jgi:hypothetical protein
MDYSAYVQHMPRSIVVLPPLNQTAEVHASNAFLSTITIPLAERGYYVFPIALVDQYMKENGLPTPGEMHQVSPAKIGEVFGADAVLYITILQWKTQYIIINASTTVALEYRLVDTATGKELWRQSQTISQDSGVGGGPIGMVVGATLQALASAATHPEQQLATQANYTIINNPNRGMLYGELSPKYAEDQAKHQEELARQKAKQAQGGG